MLTLIAPIGGGRATYRCECGSVVEKCIQNVNSGGTRSCGCVRRRITIERFQTHGHKSGGKRSRTYAIWTNMRQRCGNPKNIGFHLYGGRGIKVCGRWARFENFLADMGEAPEGLSIDRIDNDKGYSPDNCRWATLNEQANNKRNCILLTHAGKTQTAAEWSREYGVGYDTFRKRLERGVPFDLALSKTHYLRMA